MMSQPRISRVCRSLRMRRIMPSPREARAYISGRGLSAEEIAGLAAQRGGDALEGFNRDIRLSTGFDGAPSLATPREFRLLCCLLLAELHLLAKSFDFLNVHGHSVPA